MREFSLSVCPSVCQTRDLWQNERKLCPHSYTTWNTIYPSFVRRRMVGGGYPSTWNFGSTLWTEIADFQLIFARSASVVTPSEKGSTNTNRKSITRFPMSLRWSLYVAPKSPKGGAKPQNCRFWCKIALYLKKACYKVSLCENKVERHSLA